MELVQSGYYLKVQMGLVQMTLIQIGGCPKVDHENFSFGQWEQRKDDQLFAVAAAFWQVKIEKICEPTKSLSLTASRE